jgi:hypothetical protein
MRKVKTIPPPDGQVGNERGLVAHKGKAKRALNIIVVPPNVNSKTAVVIDPVGERGKGEIKSQVKISKCRASSQKHLRRTRKQKMPSKTFV